MRLNHELARGAVVVVVEVVVVLQSRVVVVVVVVMVVVVEVGGGGCISGITNGCVLTVLISRVHIGNEITEHLGMSLVNNIGIESVKLSLMWSDCSCYHSGTPLAKFISFVAHYSCIYKQINKYFSYRVHTRHHFP